MPRLALMLWRRFLKVATRANIALYRATGGRIGGRARRIPVLLLTTTGRKSGKVRTMPLAYITDGDAYVVAASFVSFGKKPGWFYNLKGQPEASVQVKNARIDVIAHEALGSERERLWAMLLEAEPGFARFEAHSQQTIPVMILRPPKIALKQPLVIKSL